MIQGRSDGEEDTEWVSLTFLGHICTQVYVQVPVHIHRDARGELRVYCWFTPAYYLRWSLLLSLELDIARKLQQPSSLCHLQQWNCRHGLLPCFSHGYSRLQLRFSCLCLVPLAHRSNSLDPALHFITLFSGNKVRSYKNCLTAD